MDKSLLLAWVVVFLAAVLVAYVYLKEDASHFTILKERMDTLNAQNVQHVAQMKKVREENESLRLKFEDFNRIKTDADMVLCQIRETMAKELEFHRGAMNANNSKFEQMNQNYEKTRENIRAIDLICSQLRQQSKPIQMAPIMVEIQTTDKTRSGKGIGALIKNETKKPKSRKK